MLGGVVPSKVKVHLFDAVPTVFNAFACIVVQVLGIVIAVKA